MHLGRFGEQIVLKSERAFEQLRFMDYEIAGSKEWYLKRRHAGYTAETTSHICRSDTKDTGRKDRDSDSDGSAVRTAAKNISKASGQYLQQFAAALNCRMEDLMDSPAPLVDLAERHHRSD